MGSSFSMNDGVNFLGNKTITKGSRAFRSAANTSTPSPVSIKTLVAPTQGAIPANSGIVEIPELLRATVGALAKAGTILVKMNGATGTYEAEYRVLLQKVMDGAYAKDGNLSEPELRLLMTQLILEMLKSAGPGFTDWKHFLMDAMQRETLEDFLKGAQMVICAITGDPINANTGNFIYDKEDLTIEGRLPLKFRRFYNRIDTRNGCMGKGWRHNYEIELLIEEDRYVLIWDDGREEIYLRQDGQPPEALFGCFNRLEQQADGFIYITQAAITYHFNKNGKLLHTKDKNGQGLYFRYDKNGYLSQASNAFGASLSYQYEKGRLTQVTDHSGRSIVLTYELNRLSQVTNSLGYGYRYYYDKDDTISKIKNPRNVLVLQNEYDDQGRTTRQEFADGGVILYDYQEDQSRTLMTEQNGNRIAYVRDERYRNIKTIYMDGEERFAYNDRNQRIQHIDKNGNKTRFSYDEKGTISQVIYPDGAKHNMTYDADNHLLVLSVNGKTKVKNSYDTKGNLLSSEDALGRKKTFTRGEDGSVLELSQPDGSKQTFTYDNRGNVCSITDASGNTTGYHYDELNRVVKTIDGNGNQTRYQYDATNQLAKVINAKGDIRSYEYTKNGKVTRVIDFNGAVTSQEYNDMNQVKSLTAPDGGVTGFEYDLMQNVTRRILPTGAEYLYAYDPLNRMEQVTLPTGGTIRYEYDPNGNQTAMIDANGNKTVMAYDELNRITAVTEPDGAVKEYEYDMDGNLISITNAAGQSHTYCYDAAGQKISETDILGNTTSYEYNEIGKVSCVIDPRNQKALYEYAPGGILKKVTCPNGTHEMYSYDRNGNLIRRENQKGDYMDYQYDCLDRLIKMSGKFGQEQRYTYDAAGNVTSVTDANGNTTTYEYSFGGNLIAVIDAAGNKTEYAYNGAGHMTTVFRHQGRETLLRQDGTLAEVKSPFLSGPLRLTRYERNGLGKITRVVDPSGRAETYDYDSMGQLIGKTDKEGYHTAYTYTPYHKLAGIKYDDGRSVEYTYNALRQLIEVKDWLGITNIMVDTAGRAERVIDYAGREVRYQWSQTGEREAIYYPNGKKVSYQYDEIGRLVHLEDGKTAVDYQYNEDGMLAGKQYANHLQTQYSYNEMGRLEGLTHSYEDRVLEEYHYTYDKMGNKTEIRKERNAVMNGMQLPEVIRNGLQNTRGHYQYRYDSLNRLTAVEREHKTLKSYEYDAFGNRIRQYDGQKQNSQSYSYNEMDQLINSGKESYRYDQRGNLTGIMKDGRLITGYQYDETNRLSKAVDAKGQLACYQYNGLGNRVGRREYAGEVDVRTGIRSLDAVNWYIEEALNPAQEIDYLLDLTKPYHNLLSKTEVSGGVENRQDYIWDQNVVSMTEGERACIYLQDELGSPVRLLDMQGNYQTVYGYDEFGQDLLGNQGEVQPFGYTGYQKDSVGNTYFAQAREYVPGIGRFGGEDIVKGNLLLPKTMNAYLYCLANPLVYNDFDGNVPLANDSNAQEVQRPTLTGGKGLDSLYPLTPNANAPVQMLVNGNNLTIDLYVEYTGDVNLTSPSGTSYKDLANAGLQDWAGTYTGVFSETVTVQVNIHEKNSLSGNQQKYFEIKLNNTMGIPNVRYPFGGWSSQSPGRMNMYTGDSRGSGLYSDDYYQWTVAHELGHILGLDDAYGGGSTNWFADNILGIEARPDAVMVVGADDVMRYQFNGINISDVDIEMLIMAYYYDEFQYYLSYNGNKKANYTALCGSIV